MKNLTQDEVDNYNYLKVMGLYESMVFLLANKIDPPAGSVVNLETYPWRYK